MKMAIDPPVNDVLENTPGGSRSSDKSLSLLADIKYKETAKPLSIFGHWVNWSALDGLILSQGKYQPSSRGGKECQNF
jgi:hypothetical protein